MESAVRKRQRVQDLEAEATSITPVRSEIWFDDGGIVLQAEMTQFKVYKGTLTSHSVVLKDLIANMEENKGVDGCPLLYLGDTAADVDIILRALTVRGSYPADEALPFEVVAAFLRLGRKYGIGALYSDGFARLSVVCPSTLDGYQNPERKKKLKFDSLQGIGVDLLLLARELSLHSILPSVLHALSGMVILKPQQTSLLRLSADDRDLLLFTLAPLRVAHWGHLVMWLRCDEENCSQTSCGKIKMDLAIRLLTPPGTLSLHWWPEFDKVLCPKCATAGRKFHAAGRDKLWQKLPSIYGLPPWEELLAST